MSETVKMVAYMRPSRRLLEGRSNDYRRDSTTLKKQLSEWIRRHANREPVPEMVKVNGIMWSFYFEVTTLLAERLMNDRDRPDSIVSISKRDESEKSPVVLDGITDLDDWSHGTSR